MADKEQSGAAAAAESSRRDMEMKAKEESDLVHECQVRVHSRFFITSRVLRPRSCNRCLLHI